MDQGTAIALSERLAAALASHSEDYVLGTKDFSSDLIWDADFPFEEIKNLDRVVIVDSKCSTKRASFQWVRGAIRYILVSDRDPSALPFSYERGVIASIDDCVELCREFLQGFNGIFDLTTNRQVLRRTTVEPPAS